MNLGNLITMSKSLDWFRFKFKILLLAYILAFSQRQKEIRKDTQGLRVTYFSRTGYFISVLSSGILSCQELNGTHLDFTKSTKPRDGPLGDLWPIGHKNKNPCQKAVETSDSRQHQNCSQLRKPEERKKSQEIFMIYDYGIHTKHHIYTASWIPLWHLFALDMTKRLWEDQHIDLKFR